MPASSASASSLSQPPEYPGLHGHTLLSPLKLEPKSPGYHASEYDEVRVWRQEIQDLVDFLLIEQPPKPETRRTSRELLRTGSRQLRHFLGAQHTEKRNGRQKTNARNTVKERYAEYPSTSTGSKPQQWSTSIAVKARKPDHRSLRHLLRTRHPEHRFTHIVQDPAFLKDVENPSMYLINCSAQALSRGRSQRANKILTGDQDQVRYLDWRVPSLSPEEPARPASAEPHRLPRLLSKRLALTSHPAREYSCTIHADLARTDSEVPAPELGMRGRLFHRSVNRNDRLFTKAQEDNGDQDRRRSKIPLMHGARGATVGAMSNIPIALEVPSMSFEPFMLTPPSTMGRLEIEADCTAGTAGLNVTTSNDYDQQATPASSVIYLPPVPAPSPLDEEFSFPTLPLQDFQRAPTYTPLNNMERVKSSTTTASPTTSQGTAPFLSRMSSREDLRAAARAMSPTSPTTTYSPILATPPKTVLSSWQISTPPPKPAAFARKDTVAETLSTRTLSPQRPSTAPTTSFRKVYPDGKSPLSRLPAPMDTPSSASPQEATTSTSSDALHTRYVAAENAWSANATRARSRLAQRVDSVAKVKQRDCERLKRKAVAGTTAGARAKDSLEIATPSKADGAPRSEPTSNDPFHAPPPPMPQLHKAVSYDVLPPSHLRRIPSHEALPRQRLHQTVTHETLAATRLPKPFSCEVLPPSRLASATGHEALSGRAQVRGWHAETPCPLRRQPMRSRVPKPVANRLSEIVAGAEVQTSGVKAGADGSVARRDAVTEANAVAEKHESNHVSGIATVIERKPVPDATEARPGLAANTAVCNIVTLLEQSPSDAPSQGGIWSASAMRTAYRSQGTQHSLAPNTTRDIGVQGNALAAAMCDQRTQTETVAPTTTRSRGSQCTFLGPTALSHGTQAIASGRASSHGTPCSTRAEGIDEHARVDARVDALFEQRWMRLEQHLAAALGSTKTVRAEGQGE